MARPSAAHVAEYVALRTAIGVLRRLPVRVAAGIGARLGVLGYAPFRIRRAVVDSQIAAAYPDLTDAERTRMARASYANLGCSTVEAAVLPARGRGALLGMVEDSTVWPIIDDALAEGKGLILVGGHVGNWELGGAYVVARGVQMDAIARGMSNPLFDAYITATRTAWGLRMVHDSDAVRHVPRVLRAGRTAGFLVDQGAQGLASTFVPFFGRLAKTPRGPAVFALRFHTPLVYIGMLRLPSGRYRLVLERIPVVDTGERERDVDTIVAAYTAAHERCVRMAPDQNFWQHRRWKHRPPGEVDGR